MIGSGLTNHEPAILTAVHPSASLCIEVLQGVIAKVVHEKLFVPRNHLIRLESGEPSPRLVAWKRVSNVPSARDKHQFPGRHEFPISGLICRVARIDYMPCSHKVARCAPAASIHRIATHEHIQVCTCRYVYLQLDL